MIMSKTLLTTGTWVCRFSFIGYRGVSIFFYGYRGMLVTFVKV